MVPSEVIIPSAHLVIASKISDPNSCIYDVEALEENRRKKISGNLTRIKSIKYNKRVRH